MLSLLSFSGLSKTITTCLDYTPFHLSKDGKKNWNGQNIETLHHIAKQLSLDLDTSIRAPFARCIKLLESGKIDIIPGLVYTRERAQVLHLLPYGIRKPLVIFFLNNNGKPLDPDALLSGQLIGVQRSFAIPEHISNRFSPRLIVPVDSVRVGFEMILKDRITAILTTLETGSAIISESPHMQGKFDFLTLTKDSDNWIYLGISKKSFLADRRVDIANSIEMIANNPALKHLNVISVAAQK